MNIQNVKIAEVKIGHEGDILKAILGSCVGIAFYWKEKQTGGLAHCLLPQSSEKNIYEISAMYVDQAIRSLKVLMKISEDSLGEIKVTVAGGGSLMNQLSARNSSQIGQQNAESVVQLLHEQGFKIIHSDLGGRLGRRIELDCSSGKVKISEITTG